MTELQQRIEELMFDGATVGEIARELDISVDEVEAQIALLEEADLDPYEWDDAEADADALASAGFGMDEDYGYAGEEW